MKAQQNSSPPCEVPMTHYTGSRPIALTIVGSLLATVTIGLNASIARAEFRIESQTDTGRFGLTIGGANPGVEFSNTPIYQQYDYPSPNVYQVPLNQSFSNIYQYPGSHPNRSHSNIYQPPSAYPPSYYPQPGVIYRQPSVIYRRTEIISPDGNQRVILEDPQYVVPENRIIIHPDRAYHRHRRYNTAPHRDRRPNSRIYYRF
jgi:hypothetical protein